MKTIGIIAEFNPFHNGHRYLIDEARRISGADFCVVVMSGDFVQRGEPAIFDKYRRTEMALSCGADAVFELPVHYSLSSAEAFAYGSVLLLSSLGCVDEIWFGSESGNIEELMKAARIVAEEPAEYRSVLSAKLKEGLTFPSARALAAGLFIDSSILSSPNNILGVEYCKASLRITDIRIPRLCTIQRVGASYDLETPDDSLENSAASALAIRNLLKNGSDPASLKNFVPSEVLDLIRDPELPVPVIFADDFSSILYSKLSDIRSARYSSEELSESYGIPAHLISNILRHSEDAFSFTGLAQEVKNKSITYTAVCRALMRISLSLCDMRPLCNSKHIGVTAPEPFIEQSFPGIDHARILGMKKEASPLIRQINETSHVEIINKLADARTGSLLLEQSISASRLYTQILFQKYGIRQKDEYRRTIILK